MQELEKISDMRKKLGLTQTELSKLAGVSQSLIAKLESGNIDPSYSKVKSIFEALENQIKKNKNTKTAKDISTKNVVFVDIKDSIEKVVQLMKEKSISQIPVKDKDAMVGSINEDIFVDYAENRTKMNNKKAGELMQECFPIIPETSGIEVVANLLHYYKAILIKKDANITGIITKSDLLKAFK